MSIHYFLILLLVSLNSFAEPEIKVMSEPRSLEDFEHQHKGCPANSECDVIMGHQMKMWQDLIKKMSTQESLSSAAKAQELESFRGKMGIPAEFYTYSKSQQGFRPLYFSSPCKAHHAKKDEEKVLRGVAFIKSITPLKAIVWRDQTQFEVSLKDLLIAQPVTVFYPEGEVTYYLPIDDQPLFIRDKALHVVKEEEGYFFILKVEASGEWKIVDLDLTQLSNWEDKREYATCPVEKEKKTPKEFGVTFCKSVWDESSKKPVIVRMHAGCNA